MSTITQTGEAMAQRTPMRHKPVSMRLDKVLSPRNSNVVDLKRKLHEVVDLCTTSEQIPTKLSSPATKRIKREPTPGVPQLERGKKARARKEKDEALRDGVAANKDTWKRRYLAAFPTFVFYFDGIDGAKRDELTSILKELGSSIEDFFSKSVTHVLTTRAVPPERADAVIDVDGDKENAARGAGLPNKMRSPLKLGVGADTQDVLCKAASLNIKIWDLKKISRMVNELLDNHSPHKAAQPKPASLPKLLREEQLSGMTRERDPEVLRNDFHYFSSKSTYVLIEDSTAIHRPIMVKEYARLRKNEEPEYPILHGGSEGRPAFSRPIGGVAPPTHTVLLPLGQRVKPNALPAHLTAAGGLSLRRAASLNQLSKKNFADAIVVDGSTGDSHRREASGFLAASGNSVAPGSGITSMTSGALAAPGQPFSRPDKRLAFLEQRQFMSKNGPIDSSALLKAFGVRGPGALKRSMSVDAGLNARGREQPAKPGYCENCRARYDDFKTHVHHKRHRKFALNPANWAELDELLVKVQRPLNPAFEHELHKNAGRYSEVHKILRRPDPNDSMQDVQPASPSSSEHSSVSDD